MRAHTTLIVLAALLGACREGGNQRAKPERYGIGHAATPEQIAAIDIDANRAGAGLPAGQGTAQTGMLVYAQKCAMCHGPHGEGIDKAPKIISREPPAGFVFASDFKAPKTMANYWPYATTVYDYLHRTMPLNAPGSLTPDETYGLVAYLLTENGVIPPGTVIDAKSLPAVKMPGRTHFVPDDRTGGKTFR